MNEIEQARFENTYDAWAKRLLDLSAGNRLLNFKSTKLSTVQLTQPNALDLFDVLVMRGEGDGLTFPMVKPGRPAATQTLFDAPDLSANGDAPPAPPFTIIPGDIETAKAPRDLERSLKRLSDLARSAREERGINTLYLALGMLEWSPNEAAHVTQKAPLVMVPVELRREDKSQPYVLSSFDEDAEVNTTLAYLLSTQYHLTLPPLVIDGAFTGAFQEFLDSVGAAVASLGWTVQNECWLGQFQFKKLTMFSDLQEQRGTAAENPIVAALAGVGAMTGGGGIGSAETFDDVDPQEVFTVLDADSSQLRVLLRAHAGENIVVEGPPGTGKSQTITNLIAQMLSERKRVLFVSEKMAALEVVQRRLEQVGLGPYCLEIHSDKAKKGEVVKHIGRALRAAQQDAQLIAPPAEQFSELLRQRTQLNAYVRGLHTPALGARTAYKLHADLAAVQDAPNVMAALPEDRIVDDIAWETDCRRALQSMVDLAQVWEHPQDHPWFGYRSGTHSVAGTAELDAWLTTAIQHIRRWREVRDAASVITGIPVAEGLSKTQGFLTLLELFGQSPCPLPAWVSSDHLPNLRESAGELRTRTAAYWREHQALVQSFGEGYPALNGRGLAESLVV